jgi:hypothetical protein
MEGGMKMKKFAIVYCGAPYQGDEIEIVAEFPTIIEADAYWFRHIRGPGREPSTAVLSHALLVHQPDGSFSNLDELAE